MTFAGYFGNWFSNWFGDAEDEEPPEESTGGNGGGSGLVSYPQFFQRPVQRRLSHAELVACSHAVGFL